MPPIWPPPPSPVTSAGHLQTTKICSVALGVGATPRRGHFLLPELGGQRCLLRPLLSWAPARPLSRFLLLPGPASFSAGGVGWVPVLACSGISRGTFLYKSLYTFVIRSVYPSPGHGARTGSASSSPSTFIFLIYFLAELCDM